MNLLFIRSLSGIIFGILMITSVILGPMAFGILMLFASVVCLYEYLNFSIQKINKRSFYFTLILGFLMASAIYFFISSYLNWLVFPFIGLLFIFQISELLFYKSIIIANKIFALFYTILPLNFLSILYFPNFKIDQPEMILILGFFIIIWVNDTFAYFTGSLIGKHKLAGKISPKKTIEGSLGGLVFSLIAALILFRISGQLSSLTWLGFAMIIVVFGTLGDLFESKLKRTARVKDSGKIMPGHGGLLDRFDSAIFAGPFTILYLLIIST